MEADIIPPLAVGFFRLARNESFNSEYRIKMGAVLANKRPIARGYNKIKSHPKFANPEVHLKISIHAEVACILNANESELKGSSIYIYSENAEGTPRLARPCDSCMKILRDVGVKRIYYSTNQFPFWGKEDI